MAPKKSPTTTDTIAGWTNIRVRILERDGYSCRICHRDGVEAKLNVHHKDWIRTHNKHGNLVTLCQSCHHAVHQEGYKPELYEDYPEPWGNDPE
jgi:5-methylcytosine-specific restriction endonuclease McrA